MKEKENGIKEVGRKECLEWKWYRDRINTTGKENRKWEMVKGKR